MQKEGSSNSIIPPLHNTTQEDSHIKQHEVIPLRTEQNHRIVNHRYVVHHEVERDAKIDVPNFSGEHNTNAFLD